MSESAGSNGVASESSERRRILVLSHVLPFPRHAGQHLRVHYTLRALRERFHVAFATFARGDSERARVERELSLHCDEPIVLESIAGRSPWARLRHKAAGLAYAARTGLKEANYAIGKLEFAPARLEREGLAETGRFDLVLFEYWHAHEASAMFRARGFRTVLDMHDLLFRAFEAGLADEGLSGESLRKRVERYRAREEAAWLDFDALIAINREELDYAARRVPPDCRLFHAPMGTDLESWPYRGGEGAFGGGPPRFGFYGGLASRRNQDEALLCAREVMPEVWRERPDAELWIIGNKPPERVRALAADPRIRVTGFVDDPGELLGGLAALFCPWRGRFGFRSRLVEAMASGAPVVATDDAVAGMDLTPGEGFLPAETPVEMAMAGLSLAREPVERLRQGRAARATAERLFSLESTYGKLTRELDEWMTAR